MALVDFSSIAQVGDVIAEKYRVEKVIGVGGMGVVVAAHHLMLDERVALKFLLPSGPGGQEAIARFIREARAASRIKNDHVVRIMDVGQLANGAPYMVMEYLHGSDLAAWLVQRGPMPIGLAVDFVLQACEALSEAHALGIVHRDLKPANLFCVQKRDGQSLVKVLDFGISKVSASEGASQGLTATSAQFGSPLYMSPEQMREAKSVDARADIWALGIVLFELVTGRVPFDAEAMPALVLKIAVDPAPPLRTLRADTPPALEGIVARCLEKDREHRFESVDALARALRALLSGARPLVEPPAAISWLPARPSQPPGSQTRLDPIGTAPAVSAAGTRESAAWGNPPSNLRMGRRVATAAALIVVIAAAVALALGGSVRRDGIGDAATSALPVAQGSPAPPAIAVPPASHPPHEAPDLTPSPSPRLPSLPSVSQDEPVPTSSIRSRAVTPSTTKGSGGAAPRSSPAPSTATTGKASCDPPYTVDALGHHDYKPECL